MSKRVALGGAIRAIREAKKSQADPTEAAKFYGSTFATGCGMSHAHLNNIEAGRRAATQESIPIIAAALGVDVAAISYEAAESVAS